jgi:hypothetical protein
MDRFTEEERGRGRVEDSAESSKKEKKRKNRCEETRIVSEFPRVPLLLDIFMEGFAFCGSTFLVLLLECSLALLIHPSPQVTVRSFRVITRVRAAADMPLLFSHIFTLSPVGRLLLVGCLLAYLSSLLSCCLSFLLFFLSSSSFFAAAAPISNTLQK